MILLDSNVLIYASSPDSPFHSWARTTIATAVSTGGAAINVQVKSGTNQLHGSAFEYHTDNNTKARPALLPAAQVKPKFIFNQFGATAGGPPPTVRDARRSRRGCATAPARRR